MNRTIWKSKRPPRKKTDTLPDYVASGNLKKISFVSQKAIEEIRLMLDQILERDIYDFTFTQSMNKLIN